MHFFYNFRGDGLAMRLRSISTIRNYKEKGINTKAFWHVNGQCSSHFLDMFENILDIDFNFDSRIKDCQFRNKNLPQVSSVFDAKNLRETLIPSPKIKDNVLSLKEKYKIDNQIIGIHLRCTEGFDWKNETGVEKGGRSQVLLKNLKKIKNFNFKERVLIVTDNKELTEFLLCENKNFFTIEEKIFPNHSHGYHFSRSKESVEMALSIAYLLAMTDYRKTFFFEAKSYFSQLPHWLPVL